MATIRFRLNGKAAAFEGDPGRRLLWVLRSDLGLTGTKYGCGEGLCGACTVLVDDEPARACQIPVKAVKGKDVVTIEGLAVGDELHPLQKAFIEHDALQCGFCTPGMVTSSAALLAANPKPDLAAVKDALSGNLCRCGTYPRIFRAVLDTAEGR